MRMLLQGSKEYNSYHLYNTHDNRLTMSREDLGGGVDRVVFEYCFIYRGNVEGGVRYSSTYTYFILSFERNSYFVILNKNTRAPL